MLNYYFTLLNSSVAILNYLTQLSRSDKMSKFTAILFIELSYLKRSSREKYWPARELRGSHFNWNSFPYSRCFVRTFGRAL